VADFRRGAKSLKSPRGLWAPPARRAGRKLPNSFARPGFGDACMPSSGCGSPLVAFGGYFSFSRGHRAFGSRAAADCAKPGLPLSFHGGRAGGRSRRTPAPG
jgi:hypothetical protein